AQELVIDTPNGIRIPTVLESEDEVLGTHPTLAPVIGRLHEKRHRNGLACAYSPLLGRRHTLPDTVLRDCRHDLTPTNLDVEELRSAPIRGNRIVHVRPEHSLRLDLELEANVHSLASREAIYEHSVDAVSTLT